MRRGCISIGEIKCDNCQRLIPSTERYLATDEESGNEVGGGRLMRYCVDCCLAKGYAECREEKGEEVLTFFPGKKMDNP